MTERTQHTLLFRLVSGALAVLFAAFVTLGVVGITSASSDNRSVANASQVEVLEADSVVEAETIADDATPLAANPTPETAPVVAVVGVVGAVVVAGIIIALFNRTKHHHY